MPKKKSLLNNNLDYLINKGEVVDIWRDYLVEDCLTGIIENYNSSFLHVHVLNDAGLSDGIAIIKMDDITRIRFGSNTLDCISKLKEMKQTKAKKVKIKLDNIKSILEQINQKYNYLTIHTESLKEDSSFIGTIQDMDNTHISLNEYGTFNSLPKKRSILLISLNDISSIMSGGCYEEDLACLSK